MSNMEEKKDAELKCNGVIKDEEQTHGKLDESSTGDEDKKSERSEDITDEQNPNITSNGTIDGEGQENEPNQSITLKQRIVEQLEFYFGDFNIHRDTFLKKQISENDGWVPATLFNKFNRISKLTTDPTLIIDAIKESNSSLLEVDKAGKCVRRRTDLPIPTREEWLEASRPRTVLVSGFPRGNEGSFSDILEFFSKTCKFEGIIPRYTGGHQKVFKGSVLIIFNSVEETEKFVNVETIRYEGVELQKEFQNDHYKKKHLKIEKDKKERLDRKVKELSLCPPLPRGALIKVSDIPEGTLRGDLISCLLGAGFGAQGYSFIEYSDNDTQAYIRLKNENSAEEILSTILDSADKLTFKDKPLKAEVVKGDEEENILQKMTEDKYKHGKAMQQGSRRKKGLKRGQSGRKNRD